MNNPIHEGGKKSKMFQLKAKIISNKKTAPGYYKALIKAPDIARMASPGQFVTIRVGEGYEPLLRRPFSIHRVKRQDIEILYKVVGPATEILAEKNKGQILDVLGPLGNDFSLLSTRYSLLIAGGIGVAPLFFLAQKLINRTRDSENHSPIILIGAKTKKEILCKEDFKDLGCAVEISTDDGSQGFKGPVTSLLKKNLLATRPSTSLGMVRPSINSGRTLSEVERVRGMVSLPNHYSLLATIYACGPKPMLEEIATLSRKFNIPAQGSLEAHMACGTGACMGCIVETRVGYKRVCLEGPVFDLNIIKW